MFDALAAVATDLFSGSALAEAATATLPAITATAVDATLPTMLVTAGAEAAGAGLTASELASLGLTGAGALDAAGNFVDPGYPGSGMVYDANGLPYNTSSLEFPMPIDDSTIARMSQQQGMSIGLGAPDSGFTWKDGVGWARNALGLANAAAGLYGTVQNGKYKVASNNAAAASSKLSAEDAARRSKQIEDYGIGEAKTMQPWDENGGRALAGEQLKALMTDPLGVANNDPSYKLRQQAAMRATGAYGQGSGSMAVAAADASSTWYDQRLQQLAGLAGANAAPGAGGALGLSTLNSAANIAGMGQASGAFGDQAALAAHNAQTQGNINTVGAVGNVINAVGNMTGVPATTGLPGTGAVASSGMPLLGGPVTSTPTPAPITTASNPAGFDQIYPSNYVPPVTNAPGDIIKPMPLPTEQMRSSPREMGDFADTQPYPGDPIPAPNFNDGTVLQTNGYYGAMPVMYRTADNPTAQLSNLGTGNVPEGQGGGFAASNPAGFDQIYPLSGTAGDSSMAEDYGYPGVIPGQGDAQSLDYLRARSRARLAALGGGGRPEMGNPGAMIPAYQQAVGSVTNPTLQPQAQLSSLGGFLPKSDTLQVPDLFSSQMGDLLGNYLSPPGTGHGVQRIGA